MRCRLVTPDRVDTRRVNHGSGAVPEEALGDDPQCGVRAGNTQE